MSDKRQPEKISPSLAALPDVSQQPGECDTSRRGLCRGELNPDARNSLENLAPEGRRERRKTKRLTGDSNPRDSSRASKSLSARENTAVLTRPPRIPGSARI